MKRSIYRFLSYAFIFLFLHVHAINAQAQWTVMIYAQADKKLNSFAARNFNAMATIGSDENLNLLVQWNQPGKAGTWRYKIEKQQLKIVQSSTTRKEFGADVADFVKYCHTNHPAKKYALIFWNHGIGIIDPQWYQISQFTGNPRSFTTSTSIDESIVKGFSEHRGILFNMEERKYMNNQDLHHALSTIATDILKKKINLVGMDACLMAMIEVGYQIKDYAKYFVASEEVELGHGWNYLPLISFLNHAPIKTKQLAEAIVLTFEKFYKNKTQYYTQSAIKLENIDFIKQNIDHVAGNLKLCLAIDKPKILDAIIKARTLCLQFTTPCYVDIHSLYSELEKQLGHSVTQALRTNTAFKDLKSALTHGKQLIEETVFANAASQRFSRARGLSIYFPRKKIDPSYYKTLFGKDSLWIEILKETVGK